MKPIFFTNLYLIIFLFNCCSYYSKPVDEVYKLINAIDNDKTEFDFPPFISKQLRKLLKIPEPNKPVDDFTKQTANIDDKLKQTKNEMKDEFKQMNDELKQQIKDVRELLLNNFIKSSGANDDI